MSGVYSRRGKSSWNWQPRSKPCDDALPSCCRSGSPSDRSCQPTATAPSHLMTDSATSAAVFQLQLSKISYVDGNEVSRAVKRCYRRVKSSFWLIISCYLYADLKDVKLMLSLCWQQKMKIPADASCCESSITTTP